MSLLGVRSSAVFELKLASFSNAGGGGGRGPALSVSAVTEVLMSESRTVPTSSASVWVKKTGEQLLYYRQQNVTSEFVLTQDM